MNKKGELTTATLIGIILLVMSFAVVLILYFTISWKSEINKEACYEQIVMRSSFNLKYLDISTAVIPLDKCGTEKICLSMSGNDCEDFGPATKEDVITKILIKDENDVKVAFANALYDCNSLLGEGKLDFLPNNFDIKNKSYCLPCARIAFDNLAKEKLKDIDFYDLYKTMYLMKDTDGRRYLEAVYPGVSSYEYSNDIFNKLKEQNKDLKREDWAIKIKQPGGYVIISTMTAKDKLNEWLAGGAATGVALVVLGGLAFATGIGAPLGVLALSGAAGGAAFYYASPNEKYYYFSPLIYPYNLKSLVGIQCTNFQWT